MSRFKRVLSFILTMVMLVGMIPPLQLVSNAETPETVEVPFNPASGTFNIDGVTSTKNVTFYVDDPEYLYFAPQGFYKDGVWQELNVYRSGYVFINWSDATYGTGGYIWWGKNMWSEKEPYWWEPPGGQFKAIWEARDGVMTMDPNGGTITYGSSQYDAKAGREYWQIFYKDCKLGTWPLAERPGYRFGGWQDPASNWILGDNMENWDTSKMVKNGSIPGYIFQRNESGYNYSYGYDYFQGKLDILENYAGGNRTFKAIWIECGTEENPHNFETVSEATCTEAAQLKCEYCNLEKEDETRPALGHDIVHHEAWEPSCDEPGWEAYDVCTRGDYTTYVELPATGHTLGMPYDGNDGYTYVECINKANGEECPHIERVSNKYTITYDLMNDEASLGADTPKTHTYGEDTQLVPASAPNHNFEGWYYDRELTDRVAELDGVQVLDKEQFTPIKLYAKWTGKEIKITVKPNSGTLTPVGGTALAANATGSFQHTYGTDSKVSDYYTVAYKGYTLTGWKLSTDSSIIPPEAGLDILKGDAVAANAATPTLTAQWTANVFPIRYYDTMTEQFIDMDTDYITNTSWISTATYTAATTPTTPTRDGYTAKLYATRANADAGTGNITSIAKNTVTRANYPDEEIVLYVKWTPNTYTLTLYGMNGTSTPAALGTGSAGTGNRTVAITYDKDYKIEDYYTYAYTGYNFLGWDTASTGYKVVYPKDHTFNGDEFTANTPLYAVWAPDEMTITVNPNGGQLYAPDGSSPGAKTNGTITYTYGTGDVEIADFYNKIFLDTSTFTGWKLSTTSEIITDGIITAEMLQDNAKAITVTAQWATNVFPIKYYDVDNEQFITMDTDYVTNTSWVSQLTYGTSKTMSITVPTRVGYEAKVYATLENAQAGTSNITTFNRNNLTYTKYPEGEVVLYVKWTPKKYKLSLNLLGGTGTTIANGNTSKDARPLEYTYDTSYKISDFYEITQSGYKFLGWDTASVGHTVVYAPDHQFYGNEFETTPINLYAVWAPETVTVTLAPNSGTLYNPDGTSAGTASKTIPHTYGNATDISEYYTVDRVGYDFAGWKMTAPTDFPETVLITDNTIKGDLFKDNQKTLTLTAQWTPETYPIHYYIDDVRLTEDTYEELGMTKAKFDSIMAKGTHTYGTATKSLVAPARTGYTMSTWSYTLGGTAISNQNIAAAYCSHTANGEDYVINVYAKSTPLKLTVTYRNGGTTAAQTTNFKTWFGDDAYITSINYPEVLTLPTESLRTDMHFAGFYSDSACTIPITEVDSTDYITTAAATAYVYMKWEAFEETPPTGTIDLGVGTAGISSELIGVTDIRYGIYESEYNVVITGDKGNNYVAPDVEYYISDKVLTEAQVEAIESWTAAPNGEAFSLAGTPDGAYIIYVKITDDQNNKSYISSPLFVLDTEAPELTGLDKAVYCSDVEFTVDEDYLVSVTVNGTKASATDGKYTLAGSAEGSTYTVKATDKAGNVTTAEVTVYNSHDWADTTYAWSEDGKSCTATRVCTRDESHTETADAEVNGVITTPATCIAEGTTTYTATFDVDWAVAQTTTRVDVAIDNNKHVALVQVEAKAATCTEIGWNAYEHCDECGHTTYVVIPATDHNYEAVVTDPTCTTDGYTTYTCHNIDANTGIECGVTYVDDEVEATGHKYEGVVTDPTCTTDGYTTYTCTVCEDTYVDDEVEALGHTEVEMPAVAPTCENTGLTAGVKCDVCGVILTEPEVVDALGHDWNEGVIDPTPGCTSEGVITFTCQRTECGKVYSVVLDASGHKPGETVVENNVAPTCTAYGSYDNVVYCTVCDVEISRKTVTVDAFGHTEGSVVVENVIAPTCEDAGSYDNVVYCRTCNEELSRNTVPVEATGHIEGSVVAENVKAPTCTEDGSYENVVYCAVCKAELSRNIEKVPAVGHTKGEYVVEKHEDATCTENGAHIEARYCTVCSEKLDEKVQILFKTGHDYEMTASLDATCTVDGYEVYTCKNDSEHSYTVVISALGHDEVAHEAKEATCTEIGWNEYVTCNRCNYTTYEEIPAKGHTAAEAVKGNETEATCTVAGGYDLVVYCSVCDTELSRVYVTVNALGHKEELLVSKAPTCTEDGLTEGKKCSVCGVVTVEQEVISAVGHSEVVDPAVAPTCTDTGLTEGKHCSACNEILVKQEVISEKGHTKVTVDAKEPTCTEAGLTAGEYCSECGTVFTAQQIVEALGHIEIIDEAKAPTCTETGLTEGKHCDRCDAVLVAQIVVPAKGHTVGETVVENVVAPTCTADGSYDNVVKCTACGYEISRVTVTVPKTEHIASGTVAIENYVAATCTKEGSYDSVVYCKDCNAEISRETVTVPTAAHTYGAAVVENVVAPTCTADGSYDNVVYCTVCNEALSRTHVTVDKLGHTEGSVTIENSVAADCVNNGSYDNVVYCTVCNKELSRETETVEKLGHDEVAHVAKAPTCTEKGWDAYVTCTRCDYTTYVEKAALGHKYNAVVTAPTCTEKGYTTYTCSACGDSYVADYVDATNHVGEETYVLTVTENGNCYEITYCCRCDAELDRKLIDPVAQNVETGKYYTTLEVALAEVTAGDTVKLLDDVKVEDLNAPTAGYIDLNGRVLEAYTLSVGTSTHIVDSSVGNKGYLVVGSANQNINSSNCDMPVYVSYTDEEGTVKDGYRFFDSVKLQQLTPEFTEDEKTGSKFISVTFRHIIGDAATSKELFGNGALDNGIKLGVIVKVTNADGETSEELYWICSDELIASAYTNGNAIKVTITGIEAYKTITIGSVLISEDLGVEMTTYEKNGVTYSTIGTYDISTGEPINA